jgi:Polyketide cyclase / dehydrase and lipid transport
MTNVSCPTDMVNAPLAVVWALLTEPAGWANFFDIRVIDIDPPGPAVVGQRIYAESGSRFLHLGVTLEYTEIDAARRAIGLNVNLPLGITVREDLTCSVVTETQCRVNYRCDFGFPSGWRGAIARMILRREMVFGPADSLSRLKRAAEAKFLPSS